MSPRENGNEQGAPDCLKVGQWLGKMLAGPAVLFCVVLGVSLGAWANSLSCMELFGGKTKATEAKDSDPFRLLTLDGSLHQKKTQVPLSITHFVEEFLISTNGGTKVVTRNIEVMRWLEEASYEYDTHFVEIAKPHFHITKDHRSERIASADEIARIGKSRSLTQKTSDQKGVAHFESLIFDQLSFVLQSYKDEKHWPNEFMRELVAVAFRYAYQSSYISVRSKKADGTKGALFGSVRVIQTPFVDLGRDQEWQGDLNYGDPKLNWANEETYAKRLMGAFEKSFVPGIDQVSSQLPNPTLWRDLYGDRVKLSEEELLIPAIEIQDGVAMIPAPYEQVLNKRYIKERKSGFWMANIVEPGNFAATQDRKLPPALRQIAAPVLYFHMARLVQPGGGAVAYPHLIGTYASVGGDSDRFYQILGFRPQDRVQSSSAGSSQTPTPEDWNVLTSGWNGLTNAFLKRHRLKTLGPQAVEMRFRPFNQYETSWPPFEKIGH